MRRLISALGAALTLAAFAWIATGDPIVARQGAARLDRDYPVQPVSFEAVHLNDAFWAPKIETNRQASIQAAFEQCEASGRVDNFIRAAQVLRGETPASLRAPGYPFDDTDL